MGLCDRPPPLCNASSRHVYPLSLVKTRAIEEYVAEALQQGLTCRSTSPASAGVVS